MAWYDSTKSSGNSPLRSNSKMKYIVAIPQTPTKYISLLWQTTLNAFYKVVSETIKPSHFSEWKYFPFIFVFHVGIHNCSHNLLLTVTFMTSDLLPDQRLYSLSKFR